MIDVEKKQKTKECYACLPRRRGIKKMGIFSLVKNNKRVKGRENEQTQMIFVVVEVQS